MGLPVRLLRIDKTRRAHTRKKVNKKNYQNCGGPMGILFSLLNHGNNNQMGAALAIIGVNCCLHKKKIQNKNYVLKNVSCERVGEVTRAGLNWSVIIVEKLQKSKFPLFSYLY